MKFGKPTYLADKKIYTSEISDGFRCESLFENKSFTPALESFQETLKPSLTHIVITATKGWFSKGLTEQWLSERIFLQFPNNDLSDFEGTLVWQATTLVISKEQFIFHMSLIEKREVEKILIEFPEEIPPEKPIRQNSSIPREDLKRKVLKAREIAGRALFKAERLTQEYCDAYGDETDWEESDTDSN